MEKFLNQSCVGQFVLDGLTYSGVLTLSDSCISLVVYTDGNSDYLFTQEDSRTLSGTLFDLTKVTLLEGTLLSHTGFGIGSQNANGLSQRFTFEFRYAVFADSLVGDGCEFDSLSFSIPNAIDLFNFTSFTRLQNVTEPLVKRLIEDDLKDSSWDSVNNYSFGPHPAVYVYTGAIILTEFKINFGTLKIENQPIFSSTSNSGFVFKNSISCVLDFDKPMKFWEGIEKIRPLNQLLGLILGEKQILKSFKLFMNNPDDNLYVFEVYRCLNQREKPYRSIDPLDRLIHVEVETDEFEVVVNKWLSREEEWRFPRHEFFSVLDKFEYSPDILIKLCNLFDLMPKNIVEEAILNDAILCAKSSCQVLFRDLPDSLERDSILGALGRIGVKSLKQKIMDRYEIIQKSGFIELLDIKTVIDQSVDCRNFYVHNTRYKFDYYEEADQLCFFIDTLKFIYSAAEMVDCGWCAKNWIHAPHNEHPFRTYITNYESRLESLKKVLSFEKTLNKLW